MLLDRAPERQQLEQMVQAAYQGMSGAIVIQGEAGMGKTALLDYAASIADGMSIFRIAGVEAESTFAFAALHRLLLPTVDRLDALPGPQRDALGAAFGMVSAAPADNFLVGLAALSLMAGAATQGGLLGIVDDVQWIDVDSLNVLAFVARRLSADGIALIFGLRSPQSNLAGLAGVPSLQVDGLPREFAMELLGHNVLMPFDVTIAHDLITDTAGCPLALIELSRMLSAEEWAGSRPLSEPIPISRRLEDHFRRQIDNLPSDAQMFLLVVAAEPTGDPLMVRRVASDLGISPDGESIAVREHFLSVASSIEFRHPLIRSAVYSSADPANRRRIHEAFAELIDSSIYPERWARHRMASTAGTDGRLASKLEDIASIARERGGYSSEALLLTQAADLSEDQAGRCARLLRAAEAAMTAGAHHQAEGLLKLARPGLTDPVSVAEANRLDGHLRIPLGQPAAAAAPLLSSARQFLLVDQERGRKTLLEAFDACFISHEYTVDASELEIAEVALAARGLEKPSELWELLLDGTTLFLTSGPEAAGETFKLATKILRDDKTPTEDIAQWFNYGMWLANELLDDRTYAAWVERVERVTRDRGALMALLFTLIGVAQHKIRIGNFSEAEERFDEANELTEAIGLGAAAFDFLRAEVLAWRGDDVGTRVMAQALIEAGTAIGSAATVFQGHHALAVLELGAGGYAEALIEAEYVTKSPRFGWTSIFLPLVVEAGIRSGNRVSAERALAELEHRAVASGTAWALGLLARSRALVADDDTAEQFYIQAIELLETCLVVIDLDVAHLHYGEWLRRNNRRVDARRELRTAYESFSGKGAEGFAERARIELEATGERARRRTVKASLDLTPQESQIARLAGRGATNPEIAARLFISASTVDYHLRKVFRKLGITSRRQLEQALQLIESRSE
jgi:DNA-binding CsgD family transcriptional regulator/tetratricopeptide (TPR) repeat protein